MALPLPARTLHTVRTEFRYIFQNIAPFEDRTRRNFHRAQRRSMAHEWRSKVAVACSGVSGAPRSMKMGTTRSPWHYDVAARHALQSASLRLRTILHYASTVAVFPILQDGPVALRQQPSRSIPGSTHGPRADMWN
jgi:uncharacterized protein YciW